MEKFLTDNTAALFGVVGVILGAVLTFVGAMVLKRRDFTLHIWNKLLERRITAHENVITAAIEMRLITALHGIDEHGEIRRAPTVLFSKKQFLDFFASFTQLTGAGTTWLSVPTKREVNFVQDYLATLHLYLEELPSEEYVVVGEKIRQDFVDLSCSLERAAFDFFQNDVLRLKLHSLALHHKYEFEVTMKRLNDTMLMREIKNALRDSPEH